MTQLVVGLGNPGAEYAGTRHNIGWMVVDQMVADHGLEWRAARVKGYEADWRGGGQRAVLLKPTTFMNLSGDAVAPKAAELGIGVESVLVVSDELQLPLGRLKLSRGGSDGGHNGLASLIGRLGENFARLRLGVGPREKGYLRDFVLSPFRDDESELLERTRAFAGDVAARWIRGGGGAAEWPKLTAFANSRRHQPLEVMRRERDEREKGERIAAETRAGTDAHDDGENPISAHSSGPDGNGIS